MCRDSEAGHKIKGTLKLYLDSSFTSKAYNEFRNAYHIRHENWAQFIDYGYDGYYIDMKSCLPSLNLSYFLTDHCAVGTLEETLELVGPLGEQGGRYIMDQMVDLLSYMHS